MTPTTIQVPGATITYDDTAISIRQNMGGIVSTPLSQVVTVNVKYPKLAIGVGRMSITTLSAQQQGITGKNPWSVIFNKKHNGQMQTLYNHLMAAKRI